MSDLQSLLEMSPGAGAMFIGQQARDQHDKDLAEVLDRNTLAQSRQLQDRRNEELHPAALTKAGLDNDTLSAQLPGVRAQSSITQRQDKLGERTFEGDVKAKDASNDYTVTKANFDKHQIATQTMMQSAAQLSGVPVPLRLEAFKAMIAQAGINANAPDIQQMIAQIKANPNAAPQIAQTMADALGKQALAMNPAAQGGIKQAEIAAGASRYHSEKASEATVEAAKIAAKSREFAATKKANGMTLVGQMQAGKIAPDNLASIAMFNISTAENQVEYDYWKNILNMVDTYVRGKAAASQQGNPQLNSGGQLTPRTVPPTSSAIPMFNKPGGDPGAAPLPPGVIDLDHLDKNKR